jgi:hypothetical protein
LRRFVTSLLFVFLAACSTSQSDPQTSSKTQDCYLLEGDPVKCKSRPDLAAMKEGDLLSAFSGEPWTKNREDPRPLIGLALMGGGSQAGGFALGVLKRLVDTETIHEVDVLSSVSGGGYAALYLYSRAAYAQRMARPNDPDDFKKSLKSLFDHRFEYCFGREKAPNDPNALGVGRFKIRTLDWATAKNVDSPINSHLGSERDCKGYSIINPYTGKPESVELEDTCRHAAASARAIGGASMMFTRCHQDLFSSGFSKSSRTGQPGNWGRVGAEVIASVLSAPLYWATNIALDTRLQTTPSRYTYRTGIYRAFGHLPECWIEAEKGRGANEKDTYCDAASFEMRPHSDYLHSSYGLKFETLKDLSSADRAKRLPMWVINAATPTRPFWDLRRSDSADMDGFRFEFTPFGFGGHRHGYIENSPTELDVDVMTALLASAGFLDIAQRVYQPVSNGAGLLLGNLLNADWSTSIPNYRLSPGLRTAIAAIPAPLHALTRLDEASMRSKIHLGDGGISRDTFGAVALIERGVRHIFISDHVDDRAADDSNSSTGVQMQVFCELSQMLEKKNLRMVFRGRPDRPAHPHDASFKSDQHCRFVGKGNPDQGLWLPKATVVPGNRQDGDVSRLDYRKWQRPLWEGEIQCIDASVCPSIANGVRIYLMKTAINALPDFQDLRKFKPADDEEAVNCTSGEHPWVRSRCRNLDSDRAAAMEKSNPKAKPGTPPILLGWWFDGATAPSGKNAAGHSLFPQDPMELMTADNSQLLFTAYLELGNHLAFAISKKIEEIVAKKIQRPDR